MINKIITYTCNVIKNNEKLTYVIIPDETIFQIGKLHYFINEDGFITRLYDDSFSNYFLQDDFKIERVCLLNKKQYLFLRELFKIVNCKFNFTYYEKTITLKDINNKEIMVINNVNDLFNNLFILKIEFLEKEGIFNGHL